MTTTSSALLALSSRSLVTLVLRGVAASSSALLAPSSRSALAFPLRSRLWVLKALHKSKDCKRIGKYHCAIAIVLGDPPRPRAIQRCEVDGHAVAIPVGNFRTRSQARERSFALVSRKRTSQQAAQKHRNMINQLRRLPHLVSDKM